MSKKTSKKQYIKDALEGEESHKDSSSNDDLIIGIWKIVPVELGVDSNAALIFPGTGDALMRLREALKLQYKIYNNIEYVDSYHLPEGSGKGLTWLRESPLVHKKHHFYDVGKKAKSEFALLKDDIDNFKFNWMREKTQLEHEIKILSSKIENLQNDLDTKNELLYDALYGKEVEHGIQYVPISIYLDTNDSNSIFFVYTSVLDFIEGIGFVKAIELKDRKGSWIKKMIAKSKEVMSSDEVTDRIKEAEYGVEVNTIIKPLSEAEKNQSEALLNIVKSVENVPNAAIRIGSLIVVKLTAPNSGDVQIMARTLSIKECYMLNKKPSLLDNPHSLVQALAEITEEINQNHTPSNNLNH